MERILIFGNTRESREAAQTMRRRGKQVIVCVTTEYARAQLPPGTLCHIGRFDDGQMLSYIRQTNPRKVIDATHPYATATQMRIRRSAEQLGIPCQRMKIENEQEAWRDVVQWVENPAEAVAVLSRLSEENILLAGDYRNLPHYAPLLRKDHLFCRIVPTVEALDLAKKVGVPETHIVAAYGPYTRAFNSAVFDMLGIDVLVIRDVAVDGGLPVGVVTMSISGYTRESGFSSTTIAKVDVPADTLPVRTATEFVAAMPVPASPSGGAINAPGWSVPVGSSSFAPSAVITPASSPAHSTHGRISRSVHGMW